MGLFISTCKGCKADIDWFLHAQPYTCKCGAYMTAKEVEKSWHDNYFERQVEYCIARLEKGKSVDFKGFNEQYADRILFTAKQRMKEDK